MDGRPCPCRREPRAIVTNEGHQGRALWHGAPHFIESNVRVSQLGSRGSALLGECSFRFLRLPARFIQHDARDGVLTLQAAQHQVRETFTGRDGRHTERRELGIRSTSGPGACGELVQDDGARLNHGVDGRRRIRCRRRRQDRQREIEAPRPLGRVRHRLALRKIPDGESQVIASHSLRLERVDESPAGRPKGQIDRRQIGAGLSGERMFRAED